MLVDTVTVFRSANGRRVYLRGLHEAADLPAAVDSAYRLATPFVRANLEAIEATPAVRWYHAHGRFWDSSKREFVSRVPSGIVRSY